MKRIFGFVILFASACAAFADGEAADLSPAQIQALEERLAGIRDPAARLFFQAGLEQTKGEPEQAIQTLSELIVNHAHNEKWIARAELLSAELYVELGMLDAADVTARQVQVLYEGTATAETATALRSKIEKLKEDAE